MCRKHSHLRRLLVKLLFSTALLLPCYAIFISVNLSAMDDAERTQI